MNKQCTILDLTGNEITSEGADLLVYSQQENVLYIKEHILCRNLS
jgi:hypothetical protein